MSPSWAAPIRTKWYFLLRRERRPSLKHAMSTLLCDRSDELKLEESHRYKGHLSVAAPRFGDAASILLVLDGGLPSLPRSSIPFCSSAVLLECSHSIPISLLFFFTFMLSVSAVAAPSGVLPRPLWPVRLYRRLESSSCVRFPFAHRFRWVRGFRLPKNTRAKPTSVHRVRGRSMTQVGRTYWHGP